MAEMIIILKVAKKKFENFYHQNFEVFFFFFSCKRTSTSLLGHWSPPIPTVRVLYRKINVRHPAGIFGLFVLFDSCLFYGRIAIGFERFRRIFGTIHLGDDDVFICDALVGLDDGLYCGEKISCNVCIRYVGLIKRIWDWLKGYGIDYKD